ncbi:anthranilate phosphoribosyltransferase [Halorhabdus sp. CUG00001]|uniref:anthranilate phosphoribosyltransferase n=1 Tax=Halorhabdus sp. CUG00001 TaxID=2600297 RepID=UPI00131AFB2F|nr:anthranilate phosphoribosyltransferase [Halorhabdus sp. CUG00001]
MTDDDAEEWPLQRLLTEVVGSGHKSADDMTREQARQAMARILRRDPAETTLGAFWLANRWKRNTPTELAAFLDVLEAETVTRVRPDVDPVDCGANYDGKGSTALLGVAAGLVAAAAGTPVVVHSGDRIPTQKQPAYKHVLDELGVRTDLDPDASARMVEEVGFGFYYQPRFAPAVTALATRREEMGVRTFLNTIETLSNPAGSSVHLGSFYHLAFAKKLAGTLDRSRESTFERALFIQGLEGYDDVRPGSTTIAEWDGGDGVADATIETAEYGLGASEDALEVADVIGDSAAITEAVLAGDRTDAFADAVALNAALRMYAREDVPDIAAGVDTARDILDRGEATAKLAALRSF